MEKFTGLVSRYPKISFWIASFAALYAVYPVYWLYALRTWCVASIVIGIMVTLTYWVAESFMKSRHALGALLATLLLGLNVLAITALGMAYTLSYPDDEPADVQTMKLMMNFICINFMFVLSFYLSKVLSRRRLQQEQKKKDIFKSFQY